MRLEINVARQTCWPLCRQEPSSNADAGSYAGRDEITSDSTCIYGGPHGPSRPLRRGRIIRESNALSGLDVRNQPPRSLTSWNAQSTAPAATPAANSNRWFWVKFKPLVTPLSLGVETRRAQPHHRSQYQDPDQEEPSVLDRGRKSERGDHPGIAGRVRDGDRQRAPAAKDWSLPYTLGVLSRWKNGALHHFNQNPVNGHRTTLFYSRAPRTMTIFSSN
jgi:hypothetical protein